MYIPKAVIFDLDETLAVSFQAPKPDMIDRVSSLLEALPVAIMSGAGFERIERDLISRLPGNGTKLMVFPNSSSQCYMYKNGAWETVYSHLLTHDERTQIRGAIELAIVQHEELRTAPFFGERIIDRESQIAFTVVGVNAPPEVKASWDPTGVRRQSIARDFKTKLPEYDILIGGASTIDFTRKDSNKSYGVRWLAEYLNTNPETLLYVGDALYPGGNDEVVIPTGIQTRSVKNPEDTLVVIDELLASLHSS